MFQILLHMYLSPKVLIKKHRVTQECFNDICFTIKQTLVNSLVKSGELVEKKCSLPNYKFGKSIHYCNLKINGVNINKYLHKINKNIKGLGMSFIDQNKPGPISNEIILDIKKKIKR